MSGSGHQVRSTLFPGELNLFLLTARKRRRQNRPSPAITLTSGIPSSILTMRTNADAYVLIGFHYYVTHPYCCRAACYG